MYTRTVLFIHVHSSVFFTLDTRMIFISNETEFLINRDQTTAHPYVTDVTHLALE